MTTKTLCDNRKVTKITKSLIDHVYVNSPHIISDSGVVHVGISDHSLIYVTRKFPSLKSDSKFKQFRSFKHFDADLFTEELSYTDWDSYLQDSNDPNELWAFWKTKFTTP